MPLGLETVNAQTFAPKPDRSVPRGFAWTGPVMLVCLRSVLLIAAQASLALLLLLRGTPQPWRNAGDWWAVYGTVADVGCLLALHFFTRREGLRLRDLLGPVRMRLGHDLWLGLGYYLLLFPVYFASTVVAKRLLFASDGNTLVRYLSHAHPLPLWATVYGLSVWWLIWSPTEEATYQAYCLPRWRQLTGNSWVSISMVGFWWTAQHCALPLILDWRYLLFRFLAFLPGILLTMFIYLRTRRLAPMIFAHWLLDISAAIFHAIY